MERPEYLKQGEPARLFPVLSNNSKEGRTTSILLACLSKVEELASELLASLGQRTGKRTTVETFTEVVFDGQKEACKDRPDGLIIVKNGSREWRAMVEAKIGNNPLTAEQIEKYRSLSKDNGIDCVITISNQFATLPASHPLADVRKSRSKIPVFHWSWMFVLTAVDLLISNDGVADDDQRVLLNELRRFLTHESAGIRGFDRMPPEWSELNKLVSAGGKILAKSPEAICVLDAWHQETKDLSLILSRQTEASVRERLNRKHAKNPADRHKDELNQLREAHQLQVSFDIPNAAAPLEVVADLNRRTIEAGMTLRAPEDKKSSKARLNWLLRQLKSEASSDLFVRMTWPGRSEDTHFPLVELVTDPDLCEKDKNGLQVVSFHIYVAKRLGGKFTQQTNFIAELETIVPDFYREVGQDLTSWRKPAPRIRESQTDASVQSIEDEAEVVALRAQ
ncbi:putative stress response protein [Phaeobacter piscinae]|uniref:Stress response protein n=1 Tax=Phaeobacter piscinae TaxID=1580596 RepID=A0ABM6PFE9_9RHOB|nr:hypothetical protein [Phaeobacter piscinae]ATG36366.1 putative stress response protein [Phaeobacter piscinae]AUQ86887.1 putative stress response protein [Phaeobacter piscinae]AUR24770.1 putative stress response protein [Phaeobacter piscinae]